MNKLAKKKYFTSFFVTVLVVMLCLFSACSAKSIIEELPDEQIVKVVRIMPDENAGEVKTVLPEEKISSFYDLLKQLKYHKANNIFGIKATDFDGITYIIDYDNYTVRLDSHHLLVQRGEKNEKEITFDNTQPSSVFDEIYKLFE